MSVSGGPSIMQYGLRYVSLIRNVCRSLIRHVGLRWVSDLSPMGLRSGMSVSDRACRSLIGLVHLWWVSDNTNIFVNSPVTSTMQPMFDKIRHLLIYFFRNFYKDSWSILYIKRPGILLRKKSLIYESTHFFII